MHIYTKMTGYEQNEQAMSMKGLIGWTGRVNYLGGWMTGYKKGWTC